MGLPPGETDFYGERYLCYGEVDDDLDTFLVDKDERHGVTFVLSEKEMAEFGEYLYRLFSKNYIYYGWHK